MVPGPVLQSTAGGLVMALGPVLHSTAGPLYAGTVPTPHTIGTTCLITEGATGRHLLMIDTINGADTGAFHLCIGGGLTRLVSPQRARGVIHAAHLRVTIGGGATLEVRLHLLL